MHLDAMPIIFATIMALLLCNCDGIGMIPQKQQADHDGLPSRTLLALKGLLGNLNVDAGTLAWSAFTAFDSDDNSGLFKSGDQDPKFPKRFLLFAKSTTSTKGSVVPMTWTGDAAKEFCRQEACIRDTDGPPCEAGSW